MVKLRFLKDRFQKGEKEKYKEKSEKQKEEDVEEMMKELCEVK